jgi:hypothetical protein
MQYLEEELLALPDGIGVMVAPAIRLTADWTPPYRDMIAPLDAPVGCRAR